MDFVKDFFEDKIERLKTDSSFRNKVMLGGFVGVLLFLTVYDSGDGGPAYVPVKSKSETMFTSNASSERVQDERMKAAYEALQAQSQEMRAQMESVNTNYSAEREQMQAEMDRIRLEQEDLKRQLELAVSRQSQVTGTANRNNNTQASNNQGQSPQGQSGAQVQQPPIIVQQPPRVQRRNQNIISTEPLMGKGLRIVSQSKEIRIGANGEQQVAFKGEELQRKQAINQMENKVEAEEEEKPVWLPAGSMISGTVITGVNADISASTASSPPPIMIRITEEVLTPGGYYIDLRGCTIMAGVVGSLKDRRGKVRSEVLSCMRDDGSAIETSLVAFGSGSDGLEGIKGNLVHNADEMLANTVLAGTLSGFAGAVRPMNIPGVQTTPGSETLFQAPDPGQVTGIAALNGVGDSMERFSDDWISLAEQSLPYIEIQAGRKIDLITQKGLALEARI